MKRPEAGQTLLELVVVIGIMVTVVTALVFATLFALRNSQLSKNQSQATKLAQEGIEKVRSSRSRNQCINSLPVTNVNSWNGSNSDCSAGVAFWDYRISNGNCGNTTTQFCYFTLNSDNSLKYITYSDQFPTSNTEKLVEGFERVIIISDDGNFNQEKKVTALVKWVDAAGSHEAKITTLLRRL